VRHRRQRTGQFKHLPLVCVIVLIESLVYFIVKIQTIILSL